MDFKKLLLSSALLGLGLSTACIVVTDDDDDTTAGTAPTSVGGTTNDTSDQTTGDTQDTADTQDTSGTTADTAGSTGAGSSCGWGPTGDETVPEGYVCGGDGADPDGNFPMDCPADITEGGPCPTEADGQEISGVGCCDAEGNAWFCQDPDGPNGPDEPVLVLDPC